MRSFLTILSLVTISFSAFAEDSQGKISLKIQSSAGDTVMSREILDGKDSLSFKSFSNGLRFSYGNSNYGAMINFRKESANGCGTRYQAFGNNKDYEVFFVADDNTLEGMSKECRDAGIKVSEPSRMVVTVIEKATGLTSSTVMIQK